MNDGMSIEPWGAYVEDLVSFDHFCLVPVFFQTALSRCGGLSHGEGWDEAGVTYNKGATTKYQGAGAQHMD